MTDVSPIRLDPDPYEPFRLSQGFRVGDLLLISGQAAIDENGGEATFIDIAPDIGSFGYLNRFAARSLVMRGYRAALQALAVAKERGVFDFSHLRAGGPLN